MRPTIKLALFALSSTLVLATSSCQKNFENHNETIDLSDSWKFRLDPDNLGITAQWFNQTFKDSVKLPGTTDENEKGIYKNEKAVDRLSRVWYWKGAVWYQKEVIIPENWSGKNVKLLLERTKDTYVWFDDVNCGYENTLSAPQYFDLSKAISPGKHRITLLVDNAKLPPVGPSHAVDERTQTNWNGVVGKIELQMTDPVWIDEVQVYPDIKNNQVKLRINLRNLTGKQAQGVLFLKAESWNVDEPMEFGIQKKEMLEIGENQEVEFIYQFDKDAPLWDEFDPALIRMNLQLSSQENGIDYISSKQVDFGMREFKREGKYLYNNGKRIFLRGRIDCANYPITGYPPMTLDAWLKLFNQLKAYGINHWRFHSWCPPAEAFLAADMVGVYLQPELPNKRSGMDAKSMDEESVRKMYNIDYLEADKSIVNLNLKDYLKREGELIFRYFGNHPSFAMFTLGNELGRNEGMFELVDHFKKIDPRRLYAQGSNNMHWEPSFADGDDFWVISKTTKELPVRGAFFIGDFKLGHIDHFPPSTMVTYTKSIEDVNAPVIGHETGAYQVSPDFSEIPKFTGVTRARNYEIFQERLEKANMLDQYKDFVIASGKLATICYREEIETALRTPDFAGFQLLDIQDFPGQGTAPVGILNVFMESKGLIKPKEWNEFCSEVVPLLKMEKYTWTNNEEFRAEIEVAQYGPEEFTNATLGWKLTRSNGNLVADGSVPNAHLPTGKLVSLDEISCSLDKVTKADKLVLTLTLEGTKYTNHYDIWVYPAEIDNTVPEGIMVSESLNSATRKFLEAGGRALIIPDHDKLTNCIRGAFQTDYWSYPMFARGAIKRGLEPAPGSLGFLCDPDSPMFRHFPTEYHSNWQWWHLVKNCKPIILDETPAEYKPAVQTIDNFARNHKLGMIFETRYGEGSALICAIDLLNLQDKPEARQLYHSLLKYVESDDFLPAEHLDKDLLHSIIQ